MRSLNTSLSIFWISCCTKSILQDCVVITPPVCTVSIYLRGKNLKKPHKTSNMIRRGSVRKKTTVGTIKATANIYISILTSIFTVFYILKNRTIPI